VLPHAGDGHPTHAACHALCLEAAARHARQAGRALLVAESEFWQPMRSPNLLVGLSSREAALLVCALVRHRGEVRRNPYHLFFPARLMDTVRRVGESFSSGGRWPGFVFGEAYRLLRLDPDGGTRPVEGRSVWPPAGGAMEA